MRMKASVPPGRSGAAAIIALLSLLVLPGALDAQAPAAVPDAVTLEDAVLLALERNRELIDADLELDGAEQQVREAWSGVMPQLNLDATYTRNLTVPSNFFPAIIFDPTADPDELIPVRFGSDNLWSLQLRMEQPLFQAQAFIGVGAADRYRALQREVRRGTAEQVVTNTRIAFYDVLLATEQARLSRESVERVRHTLDETRALRRAGLASEYDVLRLEVQLANIEPDLRRATDAEAAAKRRLAVELGLEPTADFEVVGTLAEIDLDAATTTAAVGSPASGRAVAAAAAPGTRGESPAADALVRMALEDRSDLRQLELTEELRHVELRAEQAEYFPRVSLFGVYTINTQENGSPDFFGGSVAPRAYGRQIGVQVSVPVFTGFRRDAAVQRRRAVLEQAGVQRRLLRARAEDEIRTLTDRVDEVRARAEAQDLAVEQARRGYDIALARFREGVGSRLEVTESEVALRQSEFNYAQAVYDYLVAHARLDRAVGAVPFVDTAARTRFESSRTEP